MNDSASNKPARNKPAHNADSPGSPATVTTGSIIQVEVLLFAAAAEAAARRQCRLELPAGSRLVTLADSLAAAVPALANLIHASRWAVDCEFVSDDYVLQSDMTIAMIPPVSGG